MSKPKQPITERQQYCLDHIKAADASNDSRVAYAAAHDLKVQHLYQWKTALRRAGLLPGAKRQSSFVAVSSVTPALPPASCSLFLPNGVRLQFTGVDASTLGQILNAASALS